MGPARFETDNIRFQPAEPMHKPEQAQTPDVFVYISAESTQITTEFLSQYRREKHVTLSTKTRNEGS